MTSGKTMIKLLLLGLCLMTWALPKAQAQLWDFNELSLLLPLPRSGEEQLMWRPQSAETSGELLPLAVYNAFPALVMNSSKEVIYRSLKVVAVRIDPCFAETAMSACQRQIRLVWQPVIRSQDPRERSEFTTVDAALHTFYRLNEPEWLHLLEGLRLLRQRAPFGPGLPLQIHPVLQSQGYAGDYWRHWSTRVLPLIGAKNLIRATAMTVNPRGNLWVFLGFDVVNKALRAMPIPRLQEATSQTFVSALNDTSEFRTNMEPKPNGLEAFLQLISDSVRLKREGREDLIREGVRQALEIDNPSLQGTGTVDCASCHASRAVSHWAKAHFPQWNWRQMFPRETFQGAGNLVNTSVNPLRTDVLRAFGYFGSDPIISSRVIHDTSISAGQMSLLERVRQRR